MKNQRIADLKREIQDLKKSLKNETILELILAKVLSTREELYNIITHNYTGPAKPENILDKPLYFDLLMDVYKDYTKTDQEIYSSKRQKIVETWSIEDCFEYLQVE